MLMNRLSAGGRWRLRPDGPDKVSGKLRYLTDLALPGMLYGKVLRSREPHAFILDIRTERALLVPGVKAVVTHKDVPGLNAFGIVNPDQPVFCGDRVRYVGDAIAAVAAESKDAAERALSLIEVDYEPIPVVDDPEKAMLPGAPLLHPGGNVLHRTAYRRGDPDEAFAGCAHIVEETYYTPRQMHAYMETEGGLFIPEADGRLSVFVATQHGFKDRMQLSRILAMPESAIRIVSSPIGGSFGGKDELNVQPYGALLALKTGRPVKLHNSRRESIRAGLKRHPMKLTMKTGIDQNGKLLAHQVRIVADTGAYSTLGAPVLNFATEHAMGPYRIPNIAVEGVSAFTNNGVSGEFRGFGGNQTIFAVESQMDRLAEAAGMDPWLFRRLNLREPDDPGPFGHRILPTEGVGRVWQSVASSELWRRRGTISRSEAEPWLRRGIGSAIAMHGSGLGYGIPDPGGGRLGLSADGKLEAAFSFEEFGQGITATLDILLTEHIGCASDDLRIVIGDTDRTPHTGSSTASRSTTIAYMALRKLVPMLMEKLLPLAEAATGLPRSALAAGPGGMWTTGEEGNGPKRLAATYLALAEQAGNEIRCETSFDFPTTPDEVVGGHYLYTGVAVAVEVEVNVLTGAVRIVDQYHAIAAGPAVNPMGYIGQIEGGSVMAQGFTLFEDAIMAEGLYKTENLDTYIIPTIRDAAGGFAVHAIEELPPDDPYGPRGIGEVGTVVLAPAVTAAVHHAIGKRIQALPIRREELIAGFDGLFAEGVKTS
ncbi:xanthine dehydrogenase subunit D [Paenibacillus sp. LHD-117]|uniref:xanthine dehydrogenase subunit D n=1 Tax=Paenibacillus sp. LHD-117 TaxID=3071412 RepID=UPI0027E120CA|nr:xanthine dehydrogenase subunit D [Paenibacillus sp. LHD-117]MDQ6419133.1 xanthine dehydrogenase subunit D [Paenibacillus sp. LHD-117]